MFLEALHRVLERKLGPGASKALGPAEQQKLFGDVQELFEDTFENPLAPRYEEAVDSLAPYDPILAYRLRNQSRVIKLDSVLQTYYKQISERFSQAGPDQLVALPVMESVTIDLLRSDTLQDLADYAKLVASAIGPITRYRLGAALRRQDAPPDLEVEIEKWLTAVNAKLPDAKS